MIGPFHSVIVRNEKHLLPPMLDPKKELLKNQQAGQEEQDKQKKPHEKEMILKQRKRHKKAENQEERKRKGGETHVCDICWDEYEEENMYKYGQCGHMYFVECLREYYKVHISEGDTNLKCPYPNCSVEILPAQIEFVVDKDTYNKYQKFSWFDQMKGNLDCRWCPHPDCETVVNKVEDGPSICTTCNFEMCFACGEQYHPDKKCGWNGPNPIDEEFLRYLEAENGIKRCPLCGVHIEKDKGCNTVRCTNCKHEFCWLCLRPISLDHYSAEGPCKGKSGEPRYIMVIVVAIVGVGIVTLPLWLGPALVGYNIYKLRKRRKQKKLVKKQLTQNGSV